MIDSTKLINLSDEPKFQQITSEVLELASNFMGNRSFYIAQKHSGHFTVLRVLSNGKTKLTEGMIVSMEDSY